MQRRHPECAEGDAPALRVQGLPSPTRAAICSRLLSQPHTFGRRRCAMAEAAVWRRDLLSAELSSVLSTVKTHAMFAMAINSWLM